MDTELLISSVYDRCAIWQFNHKHHFNRGILDKYWNEIASALQTSKYAAKAKWRNLKDQYRKELKKVNKIARGDKSEELRLCRWTYFSSLRFLREEMSDLDGNPRSRFRSNHSNDSENEDDPIQTIECDNMDHSVEEDDKELLRHRLETELYTQEELEPITHKRKETIPETVANKILVLGEKQMESDNQNQTQQLSVDETSEDYHFLMSLLPHLKALSPLQKLRTRIKLTEVVINEVSKSQ